MKSSRHDLMASDFNEACDREEILQSADVDLVLLEEFRERPHSEPCAKRRKKSSGTTSATKPVGFVRNVESEGSSDSLDDFQ